VPSELSTILASQSTSITLLLSMGWSSCDADFDRFGNVLRIRGYIFFFSPLFSSLLFLPHACWTQASSLPNLRNLLMRGACSHALHLLATGTPQHGLTYRIECLGLGASWGWRYIWQSRKDISPRASFYVDGINFIELGGWSPPLCSLSLASASQKSILPKIIYILLHPILATYVRLPIYLATSSRYNPWMLKTRSCIGRRPKPLKSEPGSGLQA
jgi:hypothetical protein